MNVDQDSSENDELLISLLDDLIQQSEHGKQPDLEAVCREHPDLAGELRQLWATAMIAEDFASFTGLSSKSESATAKALIERPSADAAHRPQQIGDYNVIDELGRGGMGVVYKAHQQSLDRTVALKMILRGPLASDIDLARFRAEAEAAARLSHPNIVPVYEVGEWEGHPYFSMLYVEGTTMAQRLANGPMRSREAAELLIPVCRAIAEANSQGVLHRDLKPSNILIDGRGQPFVTDFGLAKRISGNQPENVGMDGSDSAAASLTHSGAIIGTPSYMAPEQAAGQRGEIGAHTDVYGLGAILYTALAGRPPFQAASQLDVVFMVLEQDPLPPRVMNRSVDPDLEMIALKCLQKPTDLRYASPADLADDLEAYLKNEPISARSSNITQVLSRAFRETHHASVLENWGALWMLHSLVVLLLCVTTNVMQAVGISQRPTYLSLWIIGLGLWAIVFWTLRRRAGPTTFVERQIVHIWASSMSASTCLFIVEYFMGFEVLALSPVLGLISAMVFLSKAGILTGAFYAQAVALFATGILMSIIRYSAIPDFSLSLFGLVSGLCFFCPGLKYYRQRVRGAR
ncbi:MAG: protein kinase [Planctomycetaceae bacterium]|nr:protein kinase [Planctomycetaceae bacterium]